MTELPEKALKLLALALNQGAADGEWHSAAIKAVAEMRRRGVPVAFFEITKPNSQPPPTRPDGYKMPFGKFKGQELTALPEWYMEWIRLNMELRDPLLSAIEAECARRAAQCRASNPDA